MANVCLAEVGGDLATLFGSGTRAGSSDDELLDRFVRGRGDPGAEGAFAAIVARHGPMVRSACRRMLGDPHAADDAFQAVFLILARRAATLRLGVSLGAWLHGVSVKVSARARSDAWRRRVGLDGIDPPGRPESSTSDAAELLNAIDAEIARLPGPERKAVVLCHVEGLDQRSAARRLGCPLGTLQGRLQRARTRLRSRLARRGIAPAVGLLAALGPSAAEGALPASLVGSTASIATGQGLAGTVPAGVALLASSLIRRIMMKKIAWIAIGTVGLGGLGLGAGPVIRGGDVAEARAAEDPKPSEMEKTIKAVLDDWGRQQRAIAARHKGEPRSGVYILEWRRGWADCARRLLDLAEADPADPAAADALIWPLREYSNDATDPAVAAQLNRDVDLILAHRGDDPTVARAACGSYIKVSAYRDRLVSGLLKTAKSRETKGLALLAKADYLVAEASLAWDLKARQGNLSDAYYEGLRLADPVALCREAEALFERALRDYGDVSAYRLSGRIPRDFKRIMPGHTMADEVANLLDELHGLQTGRTVSEIQGTDAAGRPSRLSDHRGKVVLLVVDGPGGMVSAADRELLARMAGRPFVLIEVTSEDRPAVAADRPAGLVTWRGDARLTGFNGQPTPIRARPTALVLDDTHTIRFRGGDTPMVASMVDELVRKAEAKPPKVAARAEAPRVPSFRERVDAMIAGLDRDWYTPLQTFRADPKTGEPTAKARIGIDECLARYDRLLDLAETNPSDSAALDAMLCILRRPRRAIKDDPFRDREHRAIGLILAHRADSPVAARVMLMRWPMVKPSFDRLVEGLAESKDREAKGVATLTLATYLEAKAKLVRKLKANPGPLTHNGRTVDPQGKLVHTRFRMFDDAYEAQLRSSDPEALLLRAERLYTRAIEEFGDIQAYVGDGGAPSWNVLDRGTSLRREASSRLDAMHGLEVGEPLPPVLGVDLDGKPARLDDHRDKVILLTLSPTAEASTRHRELVARMKGRPFVLIRVGPADAEPLDGRVDWRAATVPGAGGRPAPIRSSPSALVIDPENRLRFWGGDASPVDGLLDDLVRKAEGGRTATVAAKR